MYRCSKVSEVASGYWYSSSANPRGVSHYGENIYIDDELDPNFAKSRRFVVNNLGRYNFITIASIIDY